jgi:two-component SAPR family response regulator
MPEKEIKAVRAIIVDEEKDAIEQISILAAETGFIRIVDKFTDPVCALLFLVKTAPDIVFVDINMHGIDGLTLAREIIKKVPMARIVIITASDKFAVQAFELNALDYLLKPVNTKRFMLMSDRIRTGICERRIGKNIKIKMFNKLEVLIGDEPVKWPRSKSAELFAYLLMDHGVYLHKDKIIGELWPEYKQNKALPILQTAMYKLRQVFAHLGRQVELDYSASRYCLIIRDAECDYITTEQAIFDYKSGDISTFEAVENACRLFDKGFLTEQGYLWSIEKDEQIRNSLVRILREIAYVYSAQGNIDARINVLKLTAKMVPYDEEVNFVLLRELIKNRYFYELSDHCAWLDDILKNEYDVIPSAQLQQIIQKYKRLTAFPQKNGSN